MPPGTPALRPAGCVQIPHWRRCSIHHPRFAVALVRQIKHRLWSRDAGWRRRSGGYAILLLAEPVHTESRHASEGLPASRVGIQPGTHGTELCENIDAREGLRPLGYLASGNRKLVVTVSDTRKAYGQRLGCRLVRLRAVGIFFSYL